MWGLAQANVAVYWGQNSGGGEQSLALYCQSSNVDIVMVSFLYEFPNLRLNFGGQCNTQFSDGLLHCPTIGADIKACQALGKKVFLSLGGAVGTYGFSSDSDGQQFADVLWNKFGGGSDLERPFDDAVVDGFDFDIENKNQNGYVALANELRQKFSTGSKQYYISASPQCVYPDESVGDLLSQSFIDFAFIQFYNNYCSLDGSFNWDTWKSFASSVSPNKNIKLYVGLPGQQSSAGSGYVDASTALNQLNKIKGDSNFGGVAFWDSSSVFANGDFLDTIVSGLNNGVLAQDTTSLTIISLQPSSSSSPSSYILYNLENTVSNSYPTTLKTVYQSDFVTNSVKYCGDELCDEQTTTNTNIEVSNCGSTPCAADTTVVATETPTTTQYNTWQDGNIETDQIVTVEIPTTSAPPIVETNVKHRTHYVTVYNFKTVYYTV